MHRLAYPPLALLLAAACGCSSLGGWTDNLNPFGEDYVRADEKNPAVEVACIWQPGEGRNGKGIPARGFSGQVFFFTGQKAEPAVVDGTVRVYLFADRGTPEDRAKPLQQFDFTPEAWATHASVTSLGPGYTVFVPYPAAEPYQVRCQLRVRFTPAAGPVIWSESVTMTLEGPPRPEQVPMSLAAGSLTSPLPATTGVEVTRQRGPVTALEADGAITPATRRLRTDTFQVGGIEQTAYEVPARPAAPSSGELALEDLDAETLRKMLKETTARKSPSSHPLEAAAGDEAAPADAHPLRAAARKRPRPAAADESHALPGRIHLPGRAAVRPAHSRPHPLLAEPRDVSADATPVRTSSSHPLSRGRANDELFTKAPSFGTWQGRGD